MKHKNDDELPVEIVIGGKRYVFDEPGLNISFGKDSHGTYVSFNLGGTLNLKAVASKRSVCDCAGCAFRGMEKCVHRKLMKENAALRASARKGRD